MSVPESILPRVSIIVPCRNEQNTICLLLDAIHAQTYPRDRMEVVIADGLSTDQTRQRITDFQAQHPDLNVQVIDNPQRNIPAGLNRAIAAAQGELIVRLDAHSVPRPGYVAGCVASLQQGLGDNVGGVWEIYPGGAGWQARAIAVAAAHPLGVGDAHYRYTETPQQVDTVPFGAFPRSLIDRIGPFDENLLSNEDYEFNVRVRQAGGKVWLDPEIRSTYFARASYLDLARQYSRYGYWKARMLRRYPGTLRWRQALPPVFVLSLLVLLILSIWLPIARWIIVIESTIYILILSLVGLQTAMTYKAAADRSPHLQGRDWSLLPGVPLAIATMHLAWGSAFLWSMIPRWPR
jgi:succinoglycan biosynthesis protein ExoA